MIARTALSTKGLVKTYGRVRALDGFTLDVPAGAILGLAGANGAGKTTWMMTVAGLVQATEGEIDILGGGPFDAARHAGRLAILPQDSELPLEMTPRALYVSFARLQGLAADAARRMADETLAKLNLTAKAGTAVRALSHGMRKRVMAGQCFLGRPELLLLDEPMNGLDPAECERMRELILSGKGARTVVISSHNLHDLERLCTHVAFVAAGKVTRVAATDELTAGGRTLEDCYLETAKGTF